MKDPAKLTDGKKEPTVQEALDYIAGKTTKKNTPYLVKKLAKDILDGTWYRNQS